MEYILTFSEGLMSFISPCMLPMLPLYISYFTGDNGNTSPLPRVLAFVLGFTILFTAMGLFAGSLSFLLFQHQTTVNLICGSLVILFGLSYLDIIRLPLFTGIQSGRKIGNWFSALLFGAVFSLNLTPCVGVFLGSALMQASTSGSAFKGAILLLAYSLGLGVPFVLSALLLNKLHNAFLFIKKNYALINKISGIFLIIVGVMMATGQLNKLLAFFQ